MTRPDRAAAFLLVFASPLSVLALGVPADARPGRSAGWGLEGRAAYRFLVLGLSDMPLDDAGTGLGQSTWFEQRLRVLARMRRGSLSVVYEGDLLSGLVAGDTTAVGQRFEDAPRNEINAHRGFELRQAMVAWRTRFGELRAGQQVSDWGYGLLANSGEHRLEFGDGRLGDLVQRLSFTSRPLADLYVGLGADLVYRDANAVLLLGDLGVNAFGALFYSHKRRFAGLYAAHRSQWDRDDERLEVTALDIFATARGTLPGRMGWEAGLEGVLQVGTTSRFRPEPDLQEADVLAGGAVVRGSFSHHPTRLRLSLEVGFASGDNDINDKTVRQMTFHPDYRVGMILFSELYRWLTARAADRLADAVFYASAPHGVRHVPTDGGVTNAVYLWPRLAFGPIMGLTLKAGLLWARSVADIIDPYSTNNLAGGYNLNHFSGPADEHELGLELQLGAGYQIEILDSLDLDLGAEWARLFCGAAFSDTHGVLPPDIDRLVGRLMLRWRFL